MIDLLRSRRSIRKYKQQAIEPEKLQLLKEAVLHSPSGMHLNPWTFYFIQDQNIINQLAKAKSSSAFIAEAPLLVVISAAKDTSTTWIEDCSIAATILQLQAHQLELGSCWIQIRGRFYNEDLSSEAYIQNILKLTDTAQIEAIIAIGYPDEEKQARKPEDLDWHKIIEFV